MSLAAAGAMLVRRLSYCSSLITCKTSVFARIPGNGSFLTDRSRL